MKKVTALTALALMASLAVLAGDWIRAHYVSRQQPEPPSGDFHDPSYRDTAKAALEHFAALPCDQRVALVKNLQNSLHSVDQWLSTLQQSGYVYLCLGEDHEDATREFLARRFFSHVDVDVLLLEATPHRLGRITQELRWGRDRVPLLGADIAAVIRAATATNPNLELAGIEETKAQRLRRESQTFPGMRDTSIYGNFWRQVRFGVRHVVLFGALHCTERPNWFHGRVSRLGPRPFKAHAANVRVIGHHHDGSVEAFVYFIREIGIERNDFVIDTEALHPLMYQWFEIFGTLLTEFGSVVVFRT